jgi:hypothetical protein
MSNVIMAVGVAGTWVIAALAIWGEWLKSWLPFLKPALRIELVGISGEIVPQNNRLNARYYHVRVRNTRPRRFPAAHEVQLLIVLVEQPDAGGNPSVVFGQTLPLWWVRQEILPLRQTIGPEADASLLFVREDGALEFTPIVFPNHFPRPPIGPARFWVTLQARSVEVDSPAVRLRIDWDGQWNPGAREIMTHLVVSPAPALSN